MVRRVRISARFVEPHEDPGRASVGKKAAVVSVYLFPSVASEIFFAHSERLELSVVATTGAGATCDVVFCRKIFDLRYRAGELGRAVPQSASGTMPSYSQAIDSVLMLRRRAWRLRGKKNKVAGCASAADLLR